MKTTIVSSALLLSIALCFALPPACPTGKKKTGDGCVSLSTWDLLSAMHWLTSPPSTSCTNLQYSNGIPVCLDDIPKTGCNVVSVIASELCEIGTLDFEKDWSTRCDVQVIHHHNSLHPCIYPTELASSYPNLRITPVPIWGDLCFSCTHRQFPAKKTVHLLKVQRTSLDTQPFDGYQYASLSNLFLYMPTVIENIGQIIFTTSITVTSLVDNVGRELENGWNMWATWEMLKGFGAVSLVTSEGSFKKQPRQFSRILERAQISPKVSYYHMTLRKIGDPSERNRNNELFASWQPATVPQLKAIVPSYCTVPNDVEDERMQSWIDVELKIRCHPFQLSVPCHAEREYDAFIPCEQELMNLLAEDYAVTKNWCDFSKDAAKVPIFEIVDSEASPNFQKSRYSQREGKIRLAFLFTLYTDAKFVKRLLSRLYSADHYYLLHIDPAGSKPEFETELRQEIADKYAINKNMFIAKDVPIVYGASTATMLLTRAMRWFLEKASGWDYFVTVTGSDYPLMPLSRLEKILLYQKPPMPFVMAWTPGTSTHIFRLYKTHPVFEEDRQLAASLAATSSERGNPIGSVPMEFRSGNFGPPLFCENQQSFYYLDNRMNKSGARFDTQWLFPRDPYRRRGKAVHEEFITSFTPSFDGKMRIWKKSDPATSGLYDRESVEYIINTIEGRKYYHFFKQMLLGSEEHYYVSLLYNWPRVKNFVQSLKSQMVWNTWKAGMEEERAGGFQTHTRFLSFNEWDALIGFSKRGMMFARKFSSAKNSALLDKLDAYIHLNKSTDAGLYWPGFYDVDTWTPGKQWIAAHRHNATLRWKRRRPGNVGATSLSSYETERKQGVLRGKNALKLLDNL